MEIIIAVIGGIKEWWECEKEDIRAVVTMLVLVLIVFGCIFGIASLFFYFCKKADYKKYINGCKCGGNWEYQQAIETHRFMYECDKCGELFFSLEKYKKESEEEE